MLGISLGVNKTSRLTFNLLDLPSLLAWYDPSDTTTLFQDVAKATVVGANGDYCRAIEDVTGNSPDLTSPDDASRLTYGTNAGLHWVSGSGVSQYMSNTGITPPTDFTLAWAAEIEDVSSANKAGTVMSVRSVANGGNFVNVIADSFTEFLASLNASGLGVTSFTSTTDYLGTPVVSSLAFSETDGTITYRINGQVVASLTGYNGAIENGGVQLRILTNVGFTQQIGARIYGVVIDGSIDNISAIENQLANKIGISL